jgi:pimeloyl-ACP methyl ester carboxylesterase
MSTSEEASVPIVHVNGAQVFIDDTAAPADRPDAPTIVFGHGLLMSGRMFAAQVQRLRDRYRCVTIDWRGQGRSPAAEHGYDMDTLTQDAVEVIERLGAGPVHYVGLSMGGFVGMRLAARHPAILRSLVLLNTSAGPEDPAKVGRYRLLARIYGVVGVGPLRSQVEPILFGRSFLADPASKRQRDEWVAQVGAVKRAGMKKAIYAVTDRTPIAGELDRIATPTLVVAGADDVATPVPLAETIAASIGGARLEVLATCGHTSTIEQPDAVADLIESFVDKH